MFNAAKRVNPDKMMPFDKIFQKIGCFFKQLITIVYEQLFARKSMFKFNRFVYFLSLKGMGVLNSNKDISKSEKCFLRKYLLNLKDKNPVVFDVGANGGSYSKLIREISENAVIYSFEPHPKTYLELEEIARQNNFTAFNAGFGEKEGMFCFYDYKDRDGSAHASLYREVIECIHKNKAIEHKVKILTLDNFLKTNPEIKKINLLKIDTEGSELIVLKGARKIISEGIIDVIQFEFNEMNVISRVFFKDFYDLLEDYNFYRMVPDGIISLDGYSPIFHEIFAYQNIVAVHKQADRF